MKDFEMVTIFWIYFTKWLIQLLRLNAWMNLIVMIEKSLLLTKKVTVFQD